MAHAIIRRCLLPTILLSSRHRASAALVSRSARGNSSLTCSLSRRSFLSLPPATAATTLRMATMPSPPSAESVAMAIQLLESVYGPVASGGFPLPMQPHEAGPCCAGSGASSSSPNAAQHRYLWTDAFAVMAYQSLAEYYAGMHNDEDARACRAAVDKLIATVNSCLGRPRSDRDEDKMTESALSPTGYVGLRIGKVRSCWFYYVLITYLAMI